MVILLASFHEFALFLKIVLWIAVPLVLVSLVVTTILHYRQKKKNALISDEHPEVPPVAEVDISLVAKLQKEVHHYKRRIRDLQQALTFAKDPGEIAVAPPLAAIEPLQEQPADVKDAAWLQDLVAEQKTHVQFLQQQLESRIKSYHELEHQFREQGESLEKMSAAFSHTRLLLDDSEALCSQLKIEKELQQTTIQRLEASLQQLQAQHTQSLKLLSGDINTDPAPRTQESKTPVLESK